MQLYRMFVPIGNGLSIGHGDLFMVINTTMPEYGAVFECSGFDIENRICKWNESKGFHYLNVAKVALFDCTNNNRVSDTVFVSYDIRFPGLVSRRFYEGTISRSLDKKRWLIINDRGVKVIAPKQFTYRKVCEVDYKIASNGNRGPVSRRLRAGASAG